MTRACPDGRRGAGAARGLAVVVPAWDEAAVVGDCLASVLDQRPGVPLTVVVVANGCRDRTADVARCFAPAADRRGHDLVVAEVPARGKAAALNVGDALCPAGSHRLYLDADVRLSPGALAALVAAFADGAHLAAPAAHLDAGAAPAALRAYWRCWAALPSVHGQVVGAGAYGVSAAGRARWGAFPPVVADDLFARRHFRPGESRALDDAAFTTPVPATVGATLRVLARWRRGNAELGGAPRAGWRAALGAARARAAAGPADLAVFAAVTLAARGLAALPARPGSWARARRPVSRGGTG